LIAARREATKSAIFGTLTRPSRELLDDDAFIVTQLRKNYSSNGKRFQFCFCGEAAKLPWKATAGDWKGAALFVFVLIILYSLYLEYDSPLVPSASGLAG
jgi:hypothetical protein